MITKQYNIFLNSFRKLNVKVFMVVLYDILFYVTAALVGRFFLQIIQKKSDAIDLTGNIADLNHIAAQQLSQNLGKFFVFVILMLILIVLFIIINTTLWKGLAWLTTADKKLSVLFFKRFFKLNAVWISSWFIVVIAVAMLVKPNMVPFYLLSVGFLFFYLTSILYALFVSKKKVKIRDSLSLSVRKIHFLIVPFIVIIAIAYLAAYAYRFSGLSLHTNILSVIGLGYVAWTRYYILEAVNVIK